MKLCYPDITTPIIVDDKMVSSLIIENQQLFYRFLTDLRDQIQGLSGNAVFSIDDRLVGIDKSIDLLTDFIAFDGNRKNLMTKIMHALEKTANDERYFMRTHHMMAELESYLNDLTMEQDIELAYDKFSLNSILKAIGMRVIIDYNKLVEKLFAYMDLVRRFEGDKLFVLVNLRAFVPNTDMELFIHTVLEHGVKILLLDNYEYPLLPWEKRRIIDVDLCEM